MHVWALSSWTSSEVQTLVPVMNQNSARCVLCTVGAIAQAQYSQLTWHMGRCLMLDSPFLRRIATSLARLLINIPGDGKTKATYNLRWNLFQILCTLASLLSFLGCISDPQNVRGWTSNLCRPSFKWLLYSELKLAPQTPSSFPHEEMTYNAFANSAKGLNSKPPQALLSAIKNGVQWKQGAVP